MSVRVVAGNIRILFLLILYNKFESYSDILGAFIHYKMLDVITKLLLKRRIKKRLSVYVPLKKYHYVRCIKLINYVLIPT